MLERDDGVVTLGVTDRRMLCIFIYGRLEGGLLMKVLRHELCHAYLFSYGYAIPKDYEEILCRFVHSHAWDIMRDSETISRSIRSYKKAIK